MKSRLVPQAEGGVATPPGKGLDACAEKERKILRLVFDERRPVELNRIFLDAAAVFFATGDLELVLHRANCFSWKL